MQQDRILYLLTRKVANEASDDELAELHELTQRNPDVLYYEEAFKQLKFKQQPAKDPLASYYELKNRYGNEFEHIKPVTSGMRYLKVVLIAACLLIIPLSVFLYVRLTGKSAQQHQFIEIAAGKGVKKRITLPDGSSVWLNANSRLTYSSVADFSLQRSITLSGEAFFDVAEDKSHPFTINTDKVKIKVLGTAFNVKAYQDKPGTEALLVRGSIELTVNSNLDQKVILKPNEKVSLKQNQLLVEAVKPTIYGNKSYYEETSWVYNKLVFNDESLDVLAPRLEKRYDVKIKILNPKLGAYHFTGVLENETLVQALKSMQLIRSFKFKVVGSNVTIF